MTFEFKDKAKTRTYLILNYGRQQHQICQLILVSVLNLNKYPYQLRFSIYQTAVNCFAMMKVGGGTNSSTSNPYLGESTIHVVSNICNLFLLCTEKPFSKLKLVIKWIVNRHLIIASGTTIQTNTKYNSEININSTKLLILVWT